MDEPSFKPLPVDGQSIVDCPPVKLAARPDSTRSSLLAGREDRGRLTIQARASVVGRTGTSTSSVLSLEK